jgi:hypothetical protein
MKVIALLLSMALPAMAGWETEVSPAKLGPHPNLKPCQVGYRISWKGMVDAGKLNFVFGAKDADNASDYTVKVQGGSTGLAAKLYPNRINMVSRLDPATLRPRSFIGIEDERDETNRTETTWNGYLVKSTKTTRIAKTGAQASRDKEFKFNPVYDIFSSILYVRSQPLKDGDQITVALTPYDTPYLAKIQVQGHEQFQNRPTIKLSVSLQKIDPDTKALLPYKKFKSATLWLSDDNERLPVELRSELFIGDIRMTLADAKPLP